MRKLPVSKPNILDIYRKVFNLSSDRYDSICAIGDLFSADVDLRFSLWIVISDLAWECSSWRVRAWRFSRVFSQRDCARTEWPSEARRARHWDRASFVVPGRWCSTWRSCPASWSLTSRGSSVLKLQIYGNMNSHWVNFFFRRLQRIVMCAVNLCQSRDTITIVTITCHTTVRWASSLEY